MALAYNDYKGLVIFVGKEGKGRKGDFILLTVSLQFSLISVRDCISDKAAKKGVKRFTYNAVFASMWMIPVLVPMVVFSVIQRHLIIAAFSSFFLVPTFMFGAGFMLNRIDPSVAWNRYGGSNDISPLLIIIIPALFCLICFVFWILKNSN
ncbi:MAG TPA: hypothetical protein VG938_19160 [Verrucomicrobiae bacterium]|jgi:hypothetical protein|nr:hypothetical protein [Verrucomicrobiae bacterium]